MDSEAETQKILRIVRDERERCPIAKEFRDGLQAITQQQTANHQEVMGSITRLVAQQAVSDERSKAFESRLQAQEEETRYQRRRVSAQQWGLLVSIGMALLSLVATLIAGVVRAKAGAVLLACVLSGFVVSCHAKAERVTSETRTVEAQRMQHMLDTVAQGHAQPAV